MKEKYYLSVLGIDPGLALTGWAFLSKQSIQNRELKVDGYGYIETKAKTDNAQRLKILHQDLLSLIEEFNPQIAYLEELFFSTNTKTALQVAQARGVIILTLQLAKVKVVSVNPRTLKNFMTGYGQANKKQMQFMITKVLKLSEIPHLDDVADALAIAYYGVMKQAATPAALSKT